MKLTHFTLLLLTFAFVSGCSSCKSEGKPSENRGLIIKSFSLPECAGTPQNLPDELVINNDSTLLFYFPESSSCEWPIDLENVTLLRYPSSGKCNVQIIREVKTDNKGGYVYQKSISECGNCALSTYDEGWVIADVDDDEAGFTFRTIRN
ncbi:MAG: hypothetical protein ACPF9D_06980 [Owenweeksia sp.]